VPAGVLDAALSSVATFAIGFYAARAFVPRDLGAYSLVFTAFLLTTRFPAQLIFKPVEIAAVSMPRAVRLALLRHSLRLGAFPAVASALGISLWILLAPATIPSNVISALTITGIVCSFVSPIQDHVRHMLHLGDASWGAAGVSAVQCGVAAATIGLLVRVGVPSCWIPFGALAAANAVSLSVGLLLCFGDLTPVREGPELRFTELTRSGRWLLVVALLPTGAAFVAAALVTHLASPAAVGFAEAGRVLGQPPWVLSMGLAAVLGPRSIQAGQRGDIRAARKVSRLFAALMLLLGLPYLVLVGVAWPWNPLRHFVPNAYHVSGLVFLSVLGNMVIGMDWPYRSELIGAGRASSLAKVEAAANGMRVAVATTAVFLGSFAIPVGYIVLALARSAGYRIALRPLYGAAPGGPLPIIPPPIAAATVISDEAQEAAG
jgi:O-antigen/teichoic acid export membrane protein